MSRIIILLISALLSFPAYCDSAIPFRTCGAMEALQRQMQADPSLKSKREQIEQFTSVFAAKHQAGANQRSEATLVTIPVVVHVVYNSDAQNISDAQILSQIDILNKDYSRLNSDTANVPLMFKPVASGTGIQFCLAQRDPNGNASTGIVRKHTTQSTFTTDDAVKHASSGGDDAWDAAKYLNIWVCNLGGGLLGYAMFPGGDPAVDGVVILYTAFGNTGTAAAPYNLGRTATHEVGHWLNLYHIWGDADCGNDLVADTPTQQTSNFGCPSFPHISCSNSGDMSMNYMDYTDDRCMYMFTAGQATRMRALFANGGVRASILNSDGCIPPVQTTCSAPSGLATSNITTTTATLSWSAAGSANAYLLFYKMSTASNWDSLSANGTSVALNGLSANTNYQFRVQSLCDSSNSGFSNTATFTTAAEPGTCIANAFEPNNTMSQLAAITTGSDIHAMIEKGNDVDWFRFTNSVSQPSIQVTLSNLPKDYTLQLYKAGVLLATSANAGTADEVINYPTTALGTYWIRVSGNSSNYSSTSCYTLRVNTGAFQQPACGTPSGLAVASVTQHEVALNWNALPSALSYVLQYRPLASDTWLTATSASNSLSLSGLNAGTTYEFQVKAVCTSGTGDFSSSGSFITLNDPQNVSCTPNSYEPNNNMGQIVPINLNTEINAMIEYGSDVDWFSINNSADQSNIQVKLYNLPKDYNLQLYKSGTLLANAVPAGTTAKQINYNTTKVGTYWIRISGNASNCSKNSCYTLKAETSAAAYLAGQEAPEQEERVAISAEAVRIFPNPSNGNFSINYTASSPQTIFIRVLDLSGNELYSTDFAAEEGENSIALGLDNLSNGLYLVDIHDNKDRSVHKIMINH